MIPYPSIDPVAFRVGPLAVRWYGIAYVLGFIAAYAILKRLAVRKVLPIGREGAGDLLSWIVVGVVLGGRLGYVLFYNLPYFAAHPLKIVAVWEGGMSFHGGLLGVVVAAWLFALKRSVSFLRLADALSLAAPPGLFFGRLANFINAELYGRVTDVPWAMIFPEAGPLPRHPSQLYEAILEGPVLWAVIYWVWKRNPARPGAGLAALLGGYGVLRFLVEYTREPDAHLGFILGPFTMGQVLSIGLVVAAGGIWAHLLRQKTA